MQLREAMLCVKASESSLNLPDAREQRVTRGKLGCPYCK